MVGAAGAANSATETSHIAPQIVITILTPRAEIEKYSTLTPDSSISSATIISTLSLPLSSHHADQSWPSTDSISSSTTTISTLCDACSIPGGSVDMINDIEGHPPMPSMIEVVTKPPTQGNYPVTKEMWWHTSMQIAIPFFLAGCGTIGAGYVLSVVQYWTVFKEIKALFILVPSLVGLKGNLDTCLASRLSTQANLGNLKNKHHLLSLVIGNVGLVQVQAILSSLLVSIFAIAVSSVMEQDIQLKHAVIVCASAMTAATTSCFILDLVLIAVIVVSHRFRVNPDNVAAPFAASIGDIVSLTILSLVAYGIFIIYDDYIWVPWVIIAVYLLALLPTWFFVVYRNIHVKSVLTSGWIPIISALLISGTGGILLDSAASKYLTFVVFQPIINGIGGNLVSIQSSRIATMLHQSAVLGVLPAHSPRIFVAPWKPLITGLPHAATARILLLLSLPGQMVFIFVADLLHSGGITMAWQFVLLYLFFSACQVTILMYMAHVLTHLMWTRKVDPDSAAVPFLTASGDCIGTGLLFIVYLCLEAIGKELAEVP